MFSLPLSLRDRQNEWSKAEKERIASIPDPSIPPGHTLMPAKERLKTLEVLRERMYAFNNKVVIHIHLWMRVQVFACLGSAVRLGSTNTIHLVFNDVPGWACCKLARVGLLQTEMSIGSCCYLIKRFKRRGLLQRG